eukprot:3622279-Prymnesium_polylepis.1
MGRCQFACSRAPSTAWPRADEAAHFPDFYHLVSMLSAPPSPPLSVVVYWSRTDDFGGFAQCAALRARYAHVAAVHVALRPRALPPPAPTNTRPMHNP